MPSEICTTVYQYDELEDDAAKEKAREWFRQGCMDHEWWDCIYEDAQTIGTILGIAIDEINFSGFWSQGDGALFIGSYAYAKGWKKGLKAHMGGDAESYPTILQIGEQLQQIQKKYAYRVKSTITRSDHHYSHPYCTQIDNYTDAKPHEFWGEMNAAIDESDNKHLSEMLRTFMKWIYRQLEAEYNYQTADEQVVDGIRANEYTFLKNGKRFG